MKSVKNSINFDADFKIFEDDPDDPLDFFCI
jgi:hypothetical protein